MSDEHVSRILKMLEEGKISAAEAEKLLSAVRTDARPAGPPPPPPRPNAPPPPPPPPPPGPPPVEETSKSFEFRWGQRSGLPLDLGALGKQISDAVKKIDPERFFRDAKTGGKRWQERMKQWGRLWEDAEEAPENTLGLPSARETETRVFALPEHALVQVENNLGGIAVQGGGDGVTLEIDREAWAVTQDEAAALLRQIKVECASLGESPAPPPPADFGEAPPPPPPPGPAGPPRLEVRVTGPEGWRNGVANLRLRVPAGAALRLATTYGEVTVCETTGPVEVHSISGGLRLEGLGGDVRADTVSGEVRARNIGGPLTINGNSGDVVVEGVTRGATIAAVSGDVRVSHAEGGIVRARSVSGDVAVENVGLEAPVDIGVESVSGDIALSSARGNIALKTVSGDATGRGLEATTLQATAISGDLHVGMLQPFSGTLTATTVSGDVTIDLPEASNFRFTLDTQSGDLANDHPAANETRTDSLWTGSVGTGAGTVSVKTLSGDIRLGRQV